MKTSVASLTQLLWTTVLMSKMKLREQVWELQSKNNQKML